MRTALEAYQEKLLREIKQLGKPATKGQLMHLKRVNQELQGVGNAIAKLKKAEAEAEDI